MTDNHAITLDFHHVTVTFVTATTAVKAASSTQDIPTPEPPPSGQCICGKLRAKYVVELQNTVSDMGLGSKYKDADAAERLCLSRKYWNTTTNIT
jgi:hypothetical protein